jgi:hypothetical protein
MGCQLDSPARYVWRCAASLASVQGSDWQAECKARLVEWLYRFFSGGEDEAHSSAVQPVTRKSVRETLR